MTRSGRTYYLLFGCYSLAQFFIAPIYPLYLVSRGLDLFQMNAVLAVYLLTAFVFDLPTGALADLAGRRRSFVIGCLLRVAAYTMYTRADSFTACLGCEFVDALGTTFVSGALDAWAVDGVRADGHRGSMDALFARASAIGRALMIAGGIACGYLADVSLVIPWLVAAGLFALCAVLGGALMHEPPRPARAARAPVSFHRAAVAGVRTVAATPVLLLLCLLSLLTAFAAIPMHMLWQPHIQALAGEGFRKLGWIIAALNVASLAGSALLPRLLARFSRERVLCGAALWRGATVAGLAAAGGLRSAVATLTLQEIAFGISDPVTAAWTNEHVASAERATVLSVRSTFFTLGGAAGLVALGLIARDHGVPAAFALSAALFALTAPGFLLLGRAGGRIVAEPLAPEPATAAASKVGPPALG